MTDTSVKHLEDKLNLIKEKHLELVLSALNNDPFLQDGFKDYPYLKSYLVELMQKEGSICMGIIQALESYLNK